MVCVLLLLSLWSCDAPSVAYHNPMRVDIDARHEVSIFDLFERIELIPLETTDESIFNNIDRLIHHNGVLYIFDFRGHKILAFDSTGSFLFKIDDRGQGPQEYPYLADFEINRQGNVILVLDPITPDLIEYDLKGNYLRRTRLPAIEGAYRSLRYLGDGIIAFWTFDFNNRLKFFDSRNGNIFQEQAPEGDRILLFSPPVFHYGNFLMKDVFFNKNIYEVFPDGTYSVAYTWDFGRLNNRISMLRNFPERLNTQETAMQWLHRVENSEVVNYVFRRIGGNQTYRYALLTRKSQNVHLFHNIDEGHTLVFTEFSEGATFLPLYWSDEFVIGHGPFAGYGENTIPDAILDARNLEIKRNICEFDNPVLIKYWFRR